MKNIIMIIAFALFATGYNANAQERTKAAAKKESCCATAKSCTKEEMAACMANPSCTAEEKAKCAAKHKTKKTPARKSRVQAI